MTNAAGDLTTDEQDANLDTPEAVDGEPAPDRGQEGGIIEIKQGFSGPLPPPQMLAQYNAALPNGADRIVKMAEEQSAHRRRMESRGQVFAFILALVAILAGVGLILDGRSAEGLVSLVGALAGLAGVFIYGEVRAHNTRRVGSELEASQNDKQRSMSEL
jgi:uncharacterized membrane protein